MKFGRQRMFNWISYNQKINSVVLQKEWCIFIYFCFQGCKSGAKWSAGYSEIPKAEKTGNFELRTEAHVVQITHNKRFCNYDGAKALSAI